MKTHLGRTTLYTASIAAGASLSDAVNLDDKRVHQILVPTGWNPAALTFDVSPDGTTWYELSDMSAPHQSGVLAGGQALIVEPAIFAGLRHIRIRSGTRASPVPQAAARELGLVTL